MLHFSNSILINGSIIFIMIQNQRQQDSKEQFIDFSIQSKILTFKETPLKTKKKKQKMRESIFSRTTIKKSYRQQAKDNDGLLNPEQSFYKENQYKKQKYINFEFCGCENIAQSCEKLRTSLLKGINIKEIQSAYENVFNESVSTQRQLKKYEKLRKKQLFERLPKSYPQVYIPHLNNILQLLGNTLGISEFLCLCWIQYHAKLQHLTYFIFKDLKKSFGNKKNFINKVDRQLIFLDKSYNQEREYFGGDEFDIFVSNFYNSVGAYLIPVQHYGKLIKLLFMEGWKIFVRLLIKLISMKAQLKKILNFLKKDEIQMYFNFVKEFNWEIILDEVTEQ